MTRNKQLHLKNFLGWLNDRHHFASPNTLEIIFSLVFMAVIYRLLEVLGRDAKY